MTYTEKELDQFLHGISLSLLSKKSAQHWRYDEETAKEIEWLEALERKVRADKADRKTEPSSSEIPNNYETCKHYKLTCDLFSEICKYEPKDEPTISKMEQVEDEPKTDCDGCQHYADEYTADACYECKRSYADRYEPQTERSE